MIMLNNYRIGDKVCIISAPILYKPYDLYSRTGIIAAVNCDTFNTLYGIKLDCGLINAGRDDGLFYLNENRFVKVMPASFVRIRDTKMYKAYDKNLDEKKENKDMAALTGYTAVAVIEQCVGCCKKDYYFAIYDDGTTYMPGDEVYVSGNSNACILKIKEIITPEDAAKRFKKNITAEVICRVNTNAYDTRVEQRKEAAALKKEMDKMIKQMDETKKYDMYAAENPELKEMLDKFKNLTGVK